jgi:hypothetical protein
MYLIGVDLMDVNIMGMYVIGVHLAGVHAMGVYLTGVHVMGVNHRKQPFLLSRTYVFAAFDLIPHFSFWH